MTILEKIKFEEDWLSEVNLTKENVKIAFGGIRATALESQPCEDAISRTELLRRIDAERNHLLDIKMDGAEHIIVHHARRIIEDMPTVKPQQRWISVSERLPESSGVYIVSRWFSDGCESKILTDACYFDGTNTWHNDLGINHSREYVNKKIVAWMPLPEPYKIPEQTLGCAED